MKRKTAGVRRPTLLVVASLVALGFVSPILWLVWNTAPSSVIDLFADGTLVGPLRRTLTVALGSAIVAVISGVTLAWLVARTDLPGRRLLAVSAPLPMVIPTYVGALAVVSGFASGGIIEQTFGATPLPRWSGPIPSVLVTGLLSSPLVYLPTLARLGQIPQSLHDAARSLGRSPVRAAITVDATLCASPIAGGALLVSLYGVSEFGAVQVFRYDTLSRVVYTSFESFDLPKARAASVVLAVIAIAIVATERLIQQRVTRFSLPKGRTGVRIPLGRVRWPIAAAAFTIPALSLLAPVGVLVFWALRGSQSRIGTVTDDLGSATTSTAVIAVSAAVVAILVVLPVARLTTRRSRWATLIAGACTVGYALPGVVIALSMVTLVLGSSVLDRWYQTMPVLIAAYVIHFGATAVRATSDAMTAVPDRVREAASLLDASPWRRLIKVELPLLAPGLAAAAGLVLLATVKELPATLLLAPIGTVTLATRLWSTWQSAYFDEVGLTAIVLLVLAGALTWVLTLRRLDRA
jgi:iron(III) transport system permease protein